MNQTSSTSPNASFSERDETVFLGLGANLGNAADNIRMALDALSRLPGVVVEKVSGLYRSAPIYPPPQPDYLNRVARLRVKLSPDELLTACRRIEEELGRERSERFGPRTIDLDILAYGDWVLDRPELAVPHPRFRERHFVLVPWAGIDPGWKDPVTGKTIAELLAAAGPDPGVRFLNRPER